MHKLDWVLRTTEHLVNGDWAPALVSSQPRINSAMHVKLNGDPIGPR